MKLDDSLRIVLAKLKKSIEDRHIGADLGAALEELAKEELDLEQLPSNLEVALTVIAEKLQTKNSREQISQKDGFSEEDYASLYQSALQLEQYFAHYLTSPRYEDGELKKQYAVVREGLLSILLPIDRESLESLFVIQNNLRGVYDKLLNVRPQNDEEGKMLGQLRRNLEAIFDQPSSLDKYYLSELCNCLEGMNWLLHHRYKTTRNFLTERQYDELLDQLSCLQLKWIDPRLSGAVPESQKHVAQKMQEQRLSDYQGFGENLFSRDSCHDLVNYSSVAKTGKQMTYLPEEIIDVLYSDLIPSAQKGSLLDHLKKFEIREIHANFPNLLDDRKILQFYLCKVALPPLRAQIMEALLSGDTPVFNCVHPQYARGWLGSSLVISPDRITPAELPEIVKRLNSALTKGDKGEIESALRSLHISDAAVANGVKVAMQMMDKQAYYRAFIAPIIGNADREEDIVKLERLIDLLESSRLAINVIGGFIGAKNVALAQNYDSTTVGVICETLNSLTGTKTHSEVCGILQNILAGVDPKIVDSLTTFVMQREAPSDADKQRFVQLVQAPKQTVYRGNIVSPKLRDLLEQSDIKIHIDGISSSWSWAAAVNTWVAMGAKSTTQAYIVNQLNPALQSRDQERIKKSLHPLLHDGDVDAIAAKLAELVCSPAALTKADITELKALAARPALTMTATVAAAETTEQEESAVALDQEADESTPKM